MKYGEVKYAQPFDFGSPEIGRQTGRAAMVC